MRQWSGGAQGRPRPPPPASDGRRPLTTLSKNVVFNLVGQGLVLALSFIAVKFIFRQLGADIFGIIYFNITLAGVLTTVLELGISSTTVREVSQHFESEPAYITTLIQTASLIYWSLGILIVVVIFIAAPVLVTHWINLSTTDAATATTMIRILSVSAMVALPRALYTSLFRGRQRMAINNIIDVSAASAQQLGIVVLLKLGAGVFPVAAWMSASMAIGIVVYIVVAARLFGWHALVPRYSAPAVRRNLRFTSMMTSYSVLALVHSQADKVIVSKLLPIAQFGLYGFVSGTMSRASFVTAAITQAAFPSFSNLFTGDRTALHIQYRKVQDLVTFGNLPLFAAIVFAALPAYSYLFNADAANHLLLPTVFLGIGFAMNASVNTPFALAVAMGRPQIPVKANVVALFVVVPVTALLIVTYGINGAAFSFVFYHLYLYVYAMPMVCRQCLDMSPWRWYLQTGKSFALGFAAYGLGWFAIAAAFGYSLPALVLGYVAGSAIYAGGAFLLIGDDLRYTLGSVQKSVRARIATRRTNGAASAPDLWPWRNTLIVASTSVGLGLLLGGMSYWHPPGAAVWMVAAVLITATVFIRTLGSTMGLIVLLIVTCFIDQYIFAVGRIDIRPEQIAVLLALLVFVGSRLRSGRGLSIRPDLAESALLGWFAIGFLSSVLDAPDRTESLKVLALLMLSSLALFLPRRLLKSDRMLVDQVVGWALLAFAAEAAYASIAYLLHLFGPSVSIGLNPATGHLDALGTLWEPNILGAMCGAGAVAWVYLGPRYFKLPWIGVALCITACVASFARGAWIAVLLVMFITLVVPAIRSRLDLRAFGMAAIASTLMTVGIFAADKVGNYTSGTGGLIQSVGNQTDILGRLRQIGPVLADLKGRLLILGGGTNSFGERHALGGSPEHLGNLELLVLNDTGLIGVIIFGVFAIAIIIAAWRMRADPRVLGLSAMMLVLVITNASTESLELMITWLLVGLLLAGIDGARSGQPASDSSQSSRYRLVTSSQL